MNFLAPAAVAFAAAIPVVIVFYLLKRKRVVHLVSSTLLWQKFLAETQASSPFQRLRHNWLLIIQILVLLLAIFALTRPYLAGEGRSGRLRVAILDASASMMAKDVPPNRFEQARAELDKLIDGLKGNDQLVLLVAAAHTEVKQSATTDKVALRRALASCVPMETPTRLAEAFKLAETLVKNRPENEGPEIHLFSDGAATGLDDFENKNLPLVYHRFGKSGDNLGIVSLDVRANPADPAQRAIFASVVNVSTNTQAAEIELLLDSDLLETRTVTLAPTNTQPLVFLAPQPKDGVFTLRINTEDALAADNRASIVSLIPHPARVLLVTRGNRFLEKALRGTPNTELATVPVLADAAQNFDIVVLDDVMPATWPTANTLAFHVANTNLFPSWEVLKGPAIVDWKSGHPLLRSVNFDTVQVGEALGVKTPPWGVSLVDSPATPLLVAGELQRQRVVWVGFDVLQSTWPLRISFPIFVANAVDWLNPSASRNAELMVRAGEPFRVPLDQQVPVAELTTPGGDRRKIPIEPGAREVIVGETYRQGTYHVKAGTNEVMFCVNLLDAAESNLTPREELPFGKYSKVTATTVKRANVELWRWIALAALAFLLFEWWYYHRRTV
jgi:VWA domain-containing protein/aerotolerance regulator-like protein